MPRFYLPQVLQEGTTISLPDTLVRHIQALRLRDGVEVCLFNGEGGEYAAKLRFSGRRDIAAEIGAHRASERESPLSITLVQGVSMGDRMDYTLQKAVELGVTRIQPLITERAARIPAERLPNRQEHWQRVIESACEQCGRNRVPVLEPVLTWQAWLSQVQGFGLVLSPQGRLPINRLEPVSELQLLAGPEGGLTQKEEDDVIAKAWVPIRLGPRILRTETAALAALAALQTLWGDFAHV